MGVDEKYGKRRQLTFRIGPLTLERLEQAARLFNLKPSEYAKRVIMRDLAVFNESPDLRRRDPRRKKQRAEEDEFEEG